MRRYPLYLTLLLCLLLTACGGREEPQQGQVSLSEETEAEDSRILLTVNGREVPAWQYEYWLRRACETIAEQYAEEGMEVDWSAQSEEETLGEYAKAQALADTALYATVENWAETYGCTVEELSDVQAEAGLTAQQSRELDRVGRLYGKLYEWYCGEDHPLVPTEEELAAFADESGWVGCRKILIPFDADKEAARQKAAEVFAALNHAEDSAQTFSDLAAADANAAAAQTVRLGDGVLSEEEEAVLATLAEGQFSGIVETQSGYAVLQRTAPESETVREALFDHLLLQAAAQAEIRCIPAYRELDTAEFWQKVQADRPAND